MIKKFQFGGISSPWLTLSSIRNDNIGLVLLVQPISPPTNYPLIPTPLNIFTHQNRGLLQTTQTTTTPLTTSSLTSNTQTTTTPLTNTSNNVVLTISGLGSTVTDLVLNRVYGNAFGDDDIGLSMGTLFSQGSSAAMGTLSSNLYKGAALTQGLGRNAGASLAGAAAGIAGNYVGRGISSLGGNSMLSRGVGAGVGTAIGGVGGTVSSNLVNGKLLFSGLTSGMNIGGLAGSVVGAGLLAAFGPSKEYGGKHGNITRTMDTTYDIIQTAAGFVPVYGLLISGAMALNKGLSNIFGSTDGMTKQDAILGSAFMPAPVKWLNMWGSSKAGTFNNQSWLNLEKATQFMGNAFGDLGSRFDLAREEAGKVYGTFSQGAKRRAQENINFANLAWDRVMAMVDLNEYLNIRSLAMSAINNLRYAQDIQGAWQPIYRGKQGMKIFNNATNHNIGMRLLSAAALIDNKQMILSAQSGTKFGKRRFTKEELEANRLKVYLLEREAAERRSKANAKGAEKFNKTANIVMGAMALLANETPFTGKEYLQAAEDLRQEKILKLHEAEKVGEAALMTDLAAPLLLKGFRWVFNKAGLLVKVPRTLEIPKGLTSNEPLIAAEKIENNLTSHLQGDEAVKMFKKYGGTPIPEGSINGELLRKYVTEARERYGLVGNNNITDEEIAQALYKHSKELGGNTAAVNALGEPLLLFRGNTLDFTEFKPRKSPKEFIDIGGTMDNSLGTLFLGELPNKSGDIGIYRYLVRGNDLMGKVVSGAGAGNKARPVINGLILNEAGTEGIQGTPVLDFPQGTTKVILYPKYNVYKLPSQASSTGYNAADAYVVRTPTVRDITLEMKTVPGEGEFKPFSWLIPKESRIGLNEREVLAKQYQEILTLAEKNQQGLLKSNKGTAYRGDEHGEYDYFALPNFNIRNAKHLLPYDLRIPRDWTNPNIYKAGTPYIIGGSTAATLYNKSK